jgi:hypothetical protein
VTRLKPPITAALANKNYKFPFIVSILFLAGGDMTVTVQLDNEESTIRFIDPSREEVKNCVWSSDPGNKPSYNEFGRHFSSIGIPKN